MATLNPIIKQTLKRYLDENPDIPKEMEDLVGRLLEIESHVQKESGGRGIDKLYEQTFSKFIDNKELIRWGKNYVK